MWRKNSVFPSVILRHRQKSKTETLDLVGLLPDSSKLSHPINQGFEVTCYTYYRPILGQTV
jgi:hypothetical protein